MSIVYLLGAGASHGESLTNIQVQERNQAVQIANAVLPNPPVNDGFFSDQLWGAIGQRPENLAADFSELFSYIRQIKPDLPVDLGSGAWQRLNVEEILTSIELDREFESPESDSAGKLIIIKNKLVRFIWRILGTCTEERFGEYARLLVSSLTLEDTVLTFNWDLLMDQEFYPFGVHRDGNPAWHYSNFFSSCLKQSIFGPAAGNIMIRMGLHEDYGVYLKLHGSLNWFYCTNSKCPAHSEIQISRYVAQALQRAIGIHWTDETCERCGSSTSPLLIPPLLRKPIAENWVIRSMWGIARRRLVAASHLVVVGFSAAPTDFYAAWLLRSTVGVRRDVQVFVINPENAVANPNSREFSRRMSSIFPYGYNSEFTALSQIGDVLERIGARQRPQA